jgi:reactive chlorine resistance protein C
MFLEHETAFVHDTSDDRSTRAILSLFTAKWRRRLAGAGRLTLRYGLVALLLLWGTFKFFAFEAEAIQPLIENSPFMSWLYPLLGVRGTSSLIGVVEVASALLIAVRRWWPLWSAIGSFVAVGTFIVTLSFLFTTPDALSPTSVWGNFLLKDIILLGASLYTAAEALDAADETAGARAHKV